MMKLTRTRVLAASVVAVFLLVPVLLAWYGTNHCQELSCVGPMINAFLAFVTVVPLLVLWRLRRRAKYPLMLGFSEAGMVYATLRSDFDFSPQFMVIAISSGIVVGMALGLAVERLRGAKHARRSC